MISLLFFILSVEPDPATAEPSASARGPVSIPTILWCSAGSQPLTRDTQQDAGEASQGLLATSPPHLIVLFSIRNGTY